LLKRQLVSIALALLMVTVFGYGLIRLFQLRFERGDVFPPYSSLRTDPLGTKVLHDALAEMPGMTVARNYKPLRNLLNVDPDATIMILGVSTLGGISGDDFYELKLLAARGQRVVLTLRSQTSKPEMFRVWEGSESEETGVRSAPAGESEKDLEATSLPPDPPSLGQVEIDYLDPRENLKAVSTAPELPDEIRWYSVLYFITRDPDWRLIYRVDEGPVLMERKFGDGSIVLASDTFFLSNEALRDDRHPALLAWLTGRHSSIVFDESHNGISERENVMTLIRKYELRSLGFAIALIAVLFVWKAAVPFAPTTTHRHVAEGVVTGRDSASGFVNLLRRSVAPNELLATCVGYWNHSCMHRAGDCKNRLNAVNRVIREIDMQPARRRDRVEGYRTITRILTRKF
jgi:hypothetical protein